MAQMIWDAVGTRLYSTGIDQVALYLQNLDGSYKNGVPWNGVSSVSESPSGGESTKIYADNMTYLDLTSKEEFGATIEAYTTPEEFDLCDGTAAIDDIPGLKIYQQVRQKFGLVYRTKIGNDTAGENYGFAIHIVWNCKASPSERSYSTTNDSPEAASMSYTITTTEQGVKFGDTSYRPLSHFTLDCTQLNGNIDSTGKPSAKVQALLDTLYGTSSTEPTLPTPEQVIAILKGEANGAG